MGQAPKCCGVKLVNGIPIKYTYNCTLFEIRFNAYN